MQDYKYVIIGGGLAGGRACDGIRKVDSEGRIVLVADEPHRPYQRPPLSKGYLTGKQGLGKVYLKKEAHYSDSQVEILSGVRASQVDPALHSVTLADGRVLKYEKLLLATGGRARRLSIPGNDLASVFTLRRIEDTNAIRDAAARGGRVLVLGGSFIGAEVAASLAQLGLDVTMVFPGSRLLERVVPEELSAFLHAKYEDNGIRILTGTKPIRLVGSEAVEQAELDNGEALPVDLVVMGVGIELNTELARSAGLELDDRGAVVVNGALQTSDPDIYAAGDIASWPSFTFGKRLRVEHWDVARGQGLRAGRNMAGEEKAYTTLPYFFSDLFDFSFEAWGDLTAWNQTVLRGSLETGSFAYTYFDQAKMVGVLAVNRPDEERKPMQQLVRMRVPYEDVAATLRDEAVGLGKLID
jgi:3-phenylpropionate/trans-cinnamate dioxygenase ferredoxin reductase subunit